MAKRSLSEGSLVRLKSRRGEMILPVSASDGLRGGQVFLPMHWGSRFVAGLGMNALTLPTFDPYSKQPELKNAAVQVEKIDLPWQFVAMAIEDDKQPGRALAGLQQLRRHLSAFEYASVGLFGHRHEGVIFRAAASVPLSPNFVAEVDAILGLNETESVLAYEDKRRSVGRRLRIKNGKLAAVRLSGDAMAKDWLRDWLAEGMSVTHLTRVLLAPAVKPPQGFVPRGRVVCNCLNVSESEILACLNSDAVQSGDRLVALQSKLRCGTKCGSCVPELRRMVAAPLQAAA